MNDKGWPPDETPVAVHVEVMATVRDDEPHAVLVLKDVLGAERVVHLPVNQAADLLVGLAKFVTQVVR